MSSFFLSLIHAGIGCSGANSSYRDSPQFDGERFTNPSPIASPEAYNPDEARFFVHNAITIGAPPEVVWEIVGASSIARANTSSTPSSTT